MGILDWFKKKEEKVEVQPTTDVSTVQPQELDVQSDYEKLMSFHNRINQPKTGNIKPQPVSTTTAVPSVLKIKNPFRGY